MPISVLTGQFPLGTGGVGFLTGVSGLPFRPDLAIFSWAGRSVTGQAEATHQFGMGFALNSNNRGGVTTQSAHSAGTAASDCRIYGSSVIQTMTAGGTFDGSADFGVFLSSGFRLVIDNQFATSQLVNYFLVGTNSPFTGVVRTVTGLTATGNQDINVGFEPECVMFLGAAATGQMNSNTPWSAFSFGAAAGSDIRNYVLAGASQKGPTNMVTFSYCRSGECVAGLNVDAVNWSARVTDWLPSGFRLKWDEVNTSKPSGMFLEILAFSGLSISLGSILSATDTNNFSGVGVGFKPSGLIFISHNNVESTLDTVQAHDSRCIGFANSPTSRNCISIIDKDAAGTSDIGVDTRTIQCYSNQSTATAIAIEGLMDLVSMDDDGFTVVMDDADPAQSFIWYIAVGEPVEEVPATPVLFDYIIDTEWLLQLTSSSVFSLENLLTLVQNNILPIENNTKFVLNTIINTDYYLSILQSNTLNLDHLLKVLAGNILDIEYEGTETVILQSFDLNVEFLSRLVPSITLDFEQLLDIRNGFNQPIDHLSLFVQNNILNIEHLLRLTSSNIVPIDNLKSVISLVNLTLASLTRVVALHNSNIDHLLHRVSDNNISIENLSRVNRSEIITLDHLVKVATQSNLDIETLTKLLVASPIDFDYLQKLRDATIFVIDNVLSVIFGNQAALENLISVNRNFIVSIESLLKVLLVNLLNLEYTGEQRSPVLQSFDLDIEYLRQFVKTGEIDIDFILLLVTALGLDVETKGRLNLDSSFTFENLRTLTRIDSVTFESLLSLIKSQDFNNDYIGSIGHFHVLNLDHIRKFAENQSLSVENLRGLSLSAIASLVYQISVNNPQIFDIDYDGVILVVSSQVAEVWIVEGRVNSWNENQDGLRWTSNSKGALFNSNDTDEIWRK